MTAILTIKDAESFFGPMVDESVRCSGRTIRPEVIVYLTGLLGGMARFSSLETSFTFKFYGSLGPDRPIILKDVGDHALFFSGFLPERLDRSGINRDHCSGIGSMAYGELSGRFRRQQLGPIFDEMSRRFLELREALGDIRKRCAMEPIPVYERLLRSHLDTFGDS